MKRSISKLLLVQLILLALVINSCKKDDSKPSGWVSSYSNIVLGDQNNHTNGHFLKPQTGESIAVESALAQQKSLAMLFFTESGGANSFLTFPADGTAASSFGTASNRLYTNNPGGINLWDQAYLNSGMINDNVSMTSIEFDALVKAKDWTKFDQAFTSNNAGKADLSYKLHYTLNPAVGDVYLIQFNGLVRAIVCIRSILTSGASGGNIRFDMIIEGRDSYVNSNLAKLIQPVKL